MFVLPLAQTVKKDVVSVYGDVQEETKATGKATPLTLSGKTPKITCFFFYYFFRIIMY